MQGADFFFLRELHMRTQIWSPKPGLRACMEQAIFFLGDGGWNPEPLVQVRAAGGGGVTHTAPSKYHDEIISLAFIHTKSGEPIVIMVFRRTIQKVLCLSPPRAAPGRLP
jgi:hypothetical protein